jgi:hypothetical protein
MESLSTLTGVQYSPVFRFLDATQGATQCELVVHAGHGWALATEQPEKGRAGLLQCAPTLAAKICREYGVEFDALVLVTRYVYGPGNESFYLQRFGHGEKDLFETARFLAPTREPLMPHQAQELLQRLAEGQHPGLEWRTVGRVGAGVKSLR